MTCKEAAQLLLENDRFLLVSHRKPDGDTLGSNAALCHALRRIGKEAMMFSNPDITDKYIPYIGEYLAPDGYEPGFVIAVDVAAPDMLCDGFDGSADLVIDHHPTNPEFGTFNCVEAERSACGEIITEIIENLPGVLDKTEATLLYMAVSTDTGCFVYLNTNSGSFATASRLLAYGADNSDINTKFFRKVSKSRLALEGKILTGLEYFRDGKIAIATITLDMMNETGATESDTDDLAGIPGRVDTEVVGITIRELEGGKTKASVRSMPEVNSYEICKRLGGGGHNMAAGCTLEVSPDEMKTLLLEAIDEVWP